MTQTATLASAPLDWTPALFLGDARMDDTHEEFVTLLNQLLVTPPDKQLPLYRAFTDHTVEHFAQEERWMLATGFSADNCHAEEHATSKDAGLAQQLKNVGFDSGTETVVGNQADGLQVKR